MIRAIHTAVRGRARYKVAGLHGSEALKKHLESQLRAYDGIQGVSASTLTGNVLVLFEPDTSAETIAERLGNVLAEHAHAVPSSNGVRRGYVGADGASPAVPPSTAGPDRSTIRHAVAQTTAPHEVPWHVMPAEAASAALDMAQDAGLSQAAAQERLQRYGPNLPPEAEARSGLSILLEQFTSLPVALLGVAAGISLLTGGVADAVVIAGVMALNATIGCVTENQTEQALHALKSLGRPSTLVLRDGHPCTVLAAEVVPGDVLMLRPGSYVAADARLLAAQRLSVDESALTGESLPVSKTTDALPYPDVPLADRRNMVYAGTLVTGGQGRAVVVATGGSTEMGRIQMLVDTAAAPETPMQRQLSAMGQQLVLLSSAVCSLVFGIGLLRGYGALAMLKTAISLAVAAVPEGLPTVATTVLALGIRNMRQQHVLIRRLEAVETLGAVQTICLDKTGTLTLNRMTVVSVYSGGREITMTDGTFRHAGERLEPLDCAELVRLLHVAVLCSESEVIRQQEEHVLHGSPTENALLHMAITAGIDAVQLRACYPLLRMQHRAEHHNVMQTWHTNAAHHRLLAVKGSPEEVLALCSWHMRDGRREPLTEAHRQTIDTANARMAGKALRVLGAAYCEWDAANDPEPAPTDLVWLGLIGMIDPIRQGVQDTIEDFHRAGIATVMLTGDQSPTAYAIGQELRLGRGEQLDILDAMHLAAINPEVMTALAGRVHVFARVSPAHKLQIVQALQRTGKVVAMTGDGINDGPALKAADIGIAMGNTGTNVAREVADVVLEDDNLESMVVAISHGRTIHNNIRKSVHFLLATNMSEIMVMVTALTTGLGQPLNAMQLLWINLLSDVAPGLALAMEPPEPDVLQQPPRNPAAPILTSADFKRIAFESVVLSTGALGAYGYGLVRYGMGARANTLAFTSLTVGQLLHTLSCRSHTHSLFSGTLLPANPYLTLAVGGSLALQLLAFVIPGLRSLLGLSSLTLLDSALVGASAILPLVVNEGTKGHRQRR